MSDTPAPAAPAFTYVPMTDDRVREVAQELVAGRIFGSWMIPEGESPMVVFMVLAFMDHAALKEMEAAGIDHVFEHMSKANAVSVNGYPTFFSLQHINNADLLRVLATAKAIKDAIKAVPAAP